MRKKEKHSETGRGGSTSGLPFKAEPGPQDPSPGPGPQKATALAPAPAPAPRLKEGRPFMERKPGAQRGQRFPSQVQVLLLGPQHQRWEGD